MRRRFSRQQIARDQYAAYIEPRPASLSTLRDVHGPKAQTTWEHDQREATKKR